MLGLVVAAMSLWATDAATCQVVVSLDFRSDVPVGNGVAIQRGDGFVIARSGSWQSASDEAAGAPLQKDGGSWRARAVDDCDIEGLPPAIAGLEAAIARRRMTFWPAVARHECLNGLPRGLLDAVILQESRYRPDAVSRAGAKGLAQLMPATAADLGVGDVFDPLGNIDGGARYLGAMIARFGSVSLGLAAYNAGPARVAAAGGIPSNRETPDYVRRVMAYWQKVTDDPLAGARAAAGALGFTRRSPD